jgi:hypothetical protein
LRAVAGGFAKADDFEIGAVARGLASHVSRLFSLLMLFCID